MEGNAPPTDYAAILADMEAKYAAMGTAIASLRALLATGALGIAIGDSLAPKDSAGVKLSPAHGLPSQGPISLPRGAFLGKTATDAIKLYLGAARRKQTNKEITQALKDGGMESLRKNFDNLVTNGLFRLKQDGIVLRFDDGWGLAEWYPESFRTRIVEKAGSSGKRKPKKKAARKAKTTAAKTAPKVPPAVPTPGLEHRIEAVLRTEPTRVFPAKKIAEMLEVNAGAVTLALGRMVGKHKAEKAQGGHRAFSGNVQEMPAKAS
jgi:hypothetical protein